MELMNINTLAAPTPRTLIADDQPDSDLLKSLRTQIELGRQRRLLNAKRQTVNYKLQIAINVQGTRPA